MFSQTSCQKTTGPSFLIIALDRLPSTAVTCFTNLPEKAKSGISNLCQESVRFTHAYTTSPLAVPALASIFTGLYPFEHKTRHNSNPGLSKNFLTLAEVAVKNSYRTGFFTGGAPVLRKSGLAQGFEVFDENIHPNLKSLHQPLSRSVEKFKSWLENDVSGKQFFASIYVPDLMFRPNNESEINFNDSLSSFQEANPEIDKELNQLWQILKTQNRWMSTYVILVGLNGIGSARTDISSPHANLHSENTQVALLVKPPKKFSDTKQSWNLDENVSLADLGYTLLDILGKKPTSELHPELPRFNLRTAFVRPDPGFEQTRPILIESAWTLWKKDLPILSALLTDHDFYFHYKNPELYNNLIDRFETNPMPNLGIQQGRMLTSLGFYPSSKENKPSPFFSEEQIVNLVKTKAWRELLTLSRKKHDKVLEYLVQKILGTNPLPPENPCINALLASKNENFFPKKCGDNLFVEFLLWSQSELAGINKETQRIKFEQAYSAYLVARKFLEFSDKNGQFLDINEEISRFSVLTELTLLLPEYEKLKQSLDSKTSIANDSFEDFDITD